MTINDKQIFSRMIADPTTAIKHQEFLTDVCATYAWFSLARVIRLSLYTNEKKKRTEVNNLALVLSSSNYYHLQSAQVKTDYTTRFLFIEKEGGSSEVCSEELDKGVIIYESDWNANEMFPKGRIVVTRSGLFYSEESEGYRMVKEVIAVNQKTDEFGQKLSIDKTTEIINMFLNKKVEKIKFDPKEILDNAKDLSIIETDEIITESMAKIYRLQGLTSEAIGIYNKLILKYPEKNRYFAGIISLIENETTNTKK